MRLGQPVYRETQGVHAARQQFIPALFDQGSIGCDVDAQAPRLGGVHSPEQVGVDERLATGDHHRLGANRNGLVQQRNQLGIHIHLLVVLPEVAEGAPEVAPPVDQEQHRARFAFDSRRRKVGIDHGTDALLEPLVPIFASPHPLVDAKACLGDR